MPKKKVVKFRCSFCNNETELPIVYAPWPPVDMDNYFTWLEGEEVRMVLLGGGIQV